MASSSSYSQPSATTSSSQLCSCDVFISFRGEDVRRTFLDHLCSALVDRNISTYKDYETLPRGEYIRPSLFKAIEGSQIAIIIFSKNYGDSAWCLDELLHIMKCNDERELIVMPIFYDVVPSEVNKQEGEFGKGFEKQTVKNYTKVDSWRKALVDASAISGWEPKNIAYGHESKVIKEIADTILKNLYPVNSNVDENLIGMSAQMQELEAHLEIGSPDVLMVGIWGVGGIGKTTLASSLSRIISHNFQGNCIVHNIREESRRRGLKALQEIIISRLLKQEMKLKDVDEGRHMISRLSRNSVLLILDDVDDSKQLDALAGSHSWFGNGSRIIITTRDEHLLRIHNVNMVFPVKLLSQEEAIQLFNKRAYNKNIIFKDYHTLSLRVVTYAARLPLALKVLGTYLYDKDEQEWRSALDRLQDTPHTEIIEQLKISFDGLESIEKELFLDIACFFRWENTYKAMEILEACGYHPHIGIRVLRQKSLLTIVDGHFDMHDLIQEMGQYIVRREHPNDPKKHTRVWKYEDIKNMYLSDAITENNETKALSCWIPKPDYIALIYKNISYMKKLRYLHVTLYDDDEDKIAKAKGPTFLSNELRYLEWSHYPRSPFPDTFIAMKLVILKLSFGLQKELWKGCKHLPQLKVLHLRRLKDLLHTPDFDGLPSLKKLTLLRCERLEKIHTSLGRHTNLQDVSVVGCSKLSMFPTITHLRKLKTLEVRSCHESFEFPEIKSNMESLVELSVSYMGIDALLSAVEEQCGNLISLQMYHCFYSTSVEVSFEGLKHLEDLQLQVVNCMKRNDRICSPWLIAKVICGSGYDESLFFAAKRLSFVLSQLPCNLRKLDLRGSRFTDGKLPSGIGKMSNLEELNVSGILFRRLDFILSDLTHLKSLDISSTWLRQFPKLPSSLIVLKANDCFMLPISEDPFANCKQLCDISITRIEIIIDCDELIESMLQGKAIENHCIRLVLEKDIKVAKEFIPRYFIRGNICRLKLPENWQNDFMGFLICVVLSSFTGRYVSSLEMLQEMSDPEYEDDVVEGQSDGYRRTHVRYISFSSLRHTTWWDSIHKAISVSFQLKISGEVTCYGFGVRMVARRSTSGPTETSTTQEESDFSRYTPKTTFVDSRHLLEIPNICNYE